MTDYLRWRTDLSDPRLAPAIDEQSFWSAQFGTLLLDHLELQRGSLVLDLGCGTGFPVLQLAERLGSSCRLVGADLWSEALARAADKLEVYDPGNVGLVRCDGAKLPFEDERFDLIVSNVGVNNFSDAPATLRECHRVTKAGGKLALTTNVKGHMAEFYAVYREVLRGFGRAEYLEGLDGNEDHRGTKESLVSLIAAPGYAPGKVVEREFGMRFLDGAAFLRCFLVRIGFLDGWRGFLDPADEVEIFTRLEAALDAVARDEGELRTTIPMVYLEATKPGG